MVFVSSDSDDGETNDRRGDNKEDDLRGQGRWDQPLFPNAGTTLAQCMLMIMAFSLSAQLSQEAQQHLLDLLSVLLPVGHILPRSKYLFDKYFGRSDLEKCFYCKSCLSFLEDSHEAINYCPSCKIQWNSKELLEKGIFLIYIPMESQLRDLLQTRDMCGMLDVSSEKVDKMNNICDIIDGLKYKKFKSQREQDDKHVITLSLNTDGIPVLSRLRFQCGQCCVLLMSYHQAREKETS